MNTEYLGLCDECGSECAVCLMEKVSATDDDRSNGPGERYRKMCSSCAFDLFESSGGEWQRVSE